MGNTEEKLLKISKAIDAKCLELFNVIPRHSISIAYWNTSEVAQEWNLFIYAEDNTFQSIKNDLIIELSNRLDGFKSLDDIQEYVKNGFNR